MDLRRPSGQSGALRSRGLSRPGIVRVSAMFAVLFGSTHVGPAQQAGPDPLVPQIPNAATTSSALSSSTADDRYRLGPGDILDIRVFNRPLLSREAVRIDGRGVIRMPLIEGDIHAACLTEVELAQEIASRYSKYLRNPQIDVFVKEFQSQPVAVIGAVNTPGRFRLQRQVRLLELLTFANGPADRAGQTLQVIQAGDRSLCEKMDGESQKDQVASSFVTYKLTDTLKGDTKSNPYVRPGDIIFIPEADQVYVVGNVFQPRAIALKEPITVSRAIAMAGGEQRDTKRDRIRIVRQLPGGTTKQEIYVDLKAIEKRQGEDIALQANDIVDVPNSAGKTLLRNLMGTIVPMVSQLPVRVIP